MSNNGGFYLQQAAEIHAGAGLGNSAFGTRTARGPLYPMLLALGFKIGGKTVQSASVLTRIFFSATVLVAYAMGRLLYSAMVGILFASFLVTSYGINRIACYIDTDIVLPLFILLFVMCCQMSLTQKKTYWTMLSGFLLAVALLIKETALFCVPLPFLVCVFAKTGRRMRYFQKALVILGTTVICLSPWIVYAAIEYGSVFAAFGVANPDFMSGEAATQGFNDAASFWFDTFTNGIWKALYRSYDSLQKVTPIAMLLLFSWMFVFMRALMFRKENDLVLAFGVVAFFPLTVWVGHLNMRVGQMTMVIMLLYFCLAAATVTVSEKMVNMGHRFIGSEKKQFENIT